MRNLIYVLLMHNELDNFYLKIISIVALIKIDI